MTGLKLKRATTAAEYHRSLVAVRACKRGPRRHGQHPKMVRKAR